MNEMINKMASNRKLATLRVNDCIGLFTKGEICEIFGFSRPTLDKRLNEHSWTYKEIQIINQKLPI